MKSFSLEKPLPPETIVRDARDAYLAENGFNMEQYDANSVSVNFFGIRLYFPNPPSRKLAVRYHDLHHVMTGYGTDATGEAEVSVWELRRGIKIFGLYVRLIILVSLFQGLLHSPRVLFKAWKASKTGNPLPTPTISHYESLLPLTLGDLRLLYGLPAAGLTGARALHLDAPNRQSERKTKR